jgi:hypothetical protein
MRAFRRLLIAFAVVAVSTRPGLAQRATPQELVQRALDALGGAAAARAVNNLAYDYVSVAYQLGQEETPLSPPRGTASSGRLVFDFANMRRLQDQEVRPGAANVPVLRQRRITTRDVGMVENGGVQNPEPAAQLAASLRSVRFEPHRLLLAALERPAALSAIPRRAYRGDSLPGVRYAADADTASLYFDPLSGRLLIVETLSDDPVLGDRRAATIYTRWTPAGPISYPRQIDGEVNGRAASHVNITSVTVNDALGDAALAIPDSIVERARRAAPPAPVTVTLVSLGTGVWRAEGGSHHSLVVEQPDGLVLVEARRTARVWRRCSIRCDRASPPRAF